MNLTELETSLQAKGYSTDTVIAQVEALNSVYRRVVGLRRWSWLETANTSLVTVTGNPAVSYSSLTDFLSIDAVRIELGAAYYNLDWVEPQVYRDEAHEDRTNGVPFAWTRQFGSIYLYPRPDNVYTLSVDYTKDPVDLAGGSDTPILPKTYHDMLVWGALSELAYRERDWNAGDRANVRFEERLQEMLGQEAIAQRQTEQQVRRYPTKWSDWNARF